MKADKTNENNFQESSNKRLDEIIKQSKAENEALKKILTGLEKLEYEHEAIKGGKAVKKKQK